MRRYRQPRLTRKDSIRNYIIPGIGMVGVTTLAMVLIVLVILRAVPGMGRIFSPDTHSNLWEEAKPDYTRTGVILVGETGEATGPLNWAPKNVAGELSETDMGQQLFVGVGCARCHGLTGEGGTFAPPVAGANPQIVQAMARFGPGGMPAFSLDVLPQEDLAAIAAYLQSLEPPVQVTPTPQLPPGTPTPQVLGQQLFDNTGCSACHGSQAQGTSFAPRLAGISEALAQTVVRSGRNAMPAFSEERLSNEELAALTAYLQSLDTPAEATPTPEPIPQDLPPRVLGQQLFERLEGGPGCAYCHGFQAQGDFGPSLLRLSEDTIRSTVRSGLEEMPTFSQEALSNEELDAIIAYIQYLATQTEVSPTPEPTPQGPAPEVRGQQLYSSTGCSACHGPQAGGTAFAPPLAGISQEVAQPVVRSGRNAMPAFSKTTLSDQDLAAIIAYLQSLETPGP